MSHDVVAASDLSINEPSSTTTNNINRDECGDIKSNIDVWKTISLTARLNDVKTNCLTAETMATSPASTCVMLAVIVFPSSSYVLPSPNVLMTQANTKTLITYIQCNLRI